ncbi:two-component regulator propeller domain-containing protein [Bacteroides sp. 224]|uniref:hybrid sensor histidine kinase/response regulator transcription factor n=1 Tax=Bacteroides sp. 224 TaxID=2302936 RepID=UPI0013D7C1F5|nr:two-component regulator propeller domain-containing protein [Bacteroides sp. 224]NDV63663.1 response regulator [Bacteroides sp. 224]
MNRILGIGFTYLLLALSFTANAYNLKQLANKEYMSNTSITSLCQDEQGVMWIGTCDGLNLYDGKQIQSPQAEGVSNYLSGNLIDKIVYTNKNTYWIQTYYGLNMLNNETGVITPYNQFNKLFFMEKDKDGTLFIINKSNSIHYYHKESQSFRELNLSGIPYSDILSFFIDKNNYMWIIMKSYGSCYEIKNQPNGDITLIPQSQESIPFNLNLSYCFYDNNCINYINSEHDFYSYNTDNKQRTYICNMKKEILKRGKISSIIKHHDDFFVGFVMDGVIRLEKETKSQIYKPQYIDINCGVFCLKRDQSQDIVWIGTDGQGVYIYSDPLYSIKPVVLDMQKAKRPVRALFWDDERTLWVGTKGNGILKFRNYHPDNNITDSPLEHLTIGNGLGSNAVYCFAESKQHILWIGDEEGLNYYSFRDHKIRRIQLMVDGRPFKYIHDIHETGNSELWLASVGMGIIKAKIKSVGSTIVLEDIRHYVINNKDFESNYFFSIFAENDSTIFFANKGYGVFTYRADANGLIPFFSNSYQNASLNNVLAMDKDSLGNYLFGTTAGLIKYKSENSYELFDAQEGFPNNTIHDIIKTKGCSFWLSTNLGLINFDTQRKIFRSYGYNDGLSVTEFSDGASYLDEKNNTLFFGGVNGFVSIQANGKPEEVYLPPVYFSQLSILGEQHNIQKYLIKEKNKNVLSLQYDQNFFSISFIAVDYLNGNNNMYSYRLEGINNQWINNGKENLISFTNMAPGKYTLQVKYYNSAYEMESEVYSIPIHIRDPWYTTTWAYIIYTLLLLGLIAVLIRSYTAYTNRKKQEKLNEIEKLHQRNVFESKLRFFTNIAHEFCTPLTLIYGPCERILTTKNLDKSVVKYVQMIQTNAERLNNLINELIEFRKIETGNRELRIESLPITTLANNVADTFADMAKSRNINFLKKIPNSVTWNSDKVFLSTILINLLSNAFKYTPDGMCIRIEIENDDPENLIVRVANEGSFIREENFKHVFNRYTVLDNFENQNGRDVSRKGLGMAISYNMAKLLKGTIRIENIPDYGVLFTLVLPAMELPSTPPAKVIATEYIPKIEVQPAFNLPVYEFNKAKPTILVIDDEIEILWFIGDLFIKDFNVITLKEPRKLNEILNEVYPNIIICDQMMNEVNGIELIHQLKSDKETAHIPIIMVSGNYEMDAQISALSAGAEMYITKPFNAEYLRISVLQMMERKEILKDYFNSPISSLEKNAGKITHKDHKKFMAALFKVINDNISDKNLTPRVLAKQLDISTRSLYRKLEEIGEESPTTIIKESRLHLTQNMLITSKKTIDEVFVYSGFSNKASFFKAFKEKYGCTPGEFRVKHTKAL